MASPNTTAALPLSLRHQLPQAPVCQKALDVACQSLPQAIFNHSLRVFLIAQWLAQTEQSEFASGPKRDVLFVACVYHDLGASDHFNGPQRFEVQGADAAESHLRSYGFDAAASHQAWTAVAVHTSPGIAERIDPLARLVRVAVLVDFDSATRESMGAVRVYSAIESDLPRLDIEKVLGDAVVGQAGGRHGHGGEALDSLTWPNTQKHPAASWPGILLRAHLQNPGYEGINPAF